MKKQLLLVPLLFCASWACANPVAERIAAGKAIAENRNGGNCLSCHYVQDGEMTGTVAPPLIQMKVRYADRQLLRAQIWDARTKNPETVMPPYGAHGVLTEEEIDLVVDWVHSL